MPWYRGDIMVKDQIIVRQHNIFINGNHPPMGASLWSGSFLSPDDFPVKPGETCRVILDDGRIGSIYIESIQVGGSRPETVNFKGSGALKTPD